MNRTSTLRPPRSATVAAIALATLVAARGSAAESVAVVAVGDPPAGLDAELAELTHQLRAACRDRIGNVLDVPTMQARLLGQSAGATLSELDRAYGGALAVFQNGEFDSALRTLRAIVEDLEALPEGGEPYQQWIRALLRLAHAAATIGRSDESDGAMAKLLRVEPNYRADPDQYSPTYRRRMEEIRGRIRALPQRRVTVLSAGRAGSIFVDGRPSGTTPMTVFLPAGRYRVGGAAAALRVPSFEVDLTAEDRTVVLDFATAEALRMASGPGLALTPARRGEGLIRAGAWLDVDKLVVASRTVEGDAPFLVGAIYDVRRGAMLREGSVRTVAGSVPSANIGALAAFLLTGAQQREVRGRSSEVAAVVPLPVDLRPAPAATADRLLVQSPNAVQDETAMRARRGWLEPRPWMRPVAWLAGGGAVGFAGLAVNRRLAANDAYAHAESLVGPAGVIASTSDRPRYRSLTAEGNTAARISWTSAGVSLILGAAAGLLGWSSAEPPASPTSF